MPDNGGILEGFDVPHAIDGVWIFDGVAGSDDRDELVAFCQSSNLDGANRLITWLAVIWLIRLSLLFAIRIRAGDKTETPGAICLSPV